MIDYQKRPAQTIAASLSIQGWQHLDPILLAALATEAPVLLIGPHGTAKTQLVEKLSQALTLTFRHYNASLLNYDDLVGIPMPEEGQDQLRFVSTPGAIWDTQFVFFDEISRCRPDLQNKLFPIVYERRVVGIGLDRLQHRWAAMNPPSPDNPDLEASMNEFYLGSEPLDPALTDRFPFVVPVPAWKDLSREDRRQLLSQHSTTDMVNGESGCDLPKMVDACRRLIPEVEAVIHEQVADYVLCVMDLLDKAKYPQSPRRARMLLRSIAAVQAARMILEGEDADLDRSAELALLYGLPHNATEVPPAPATIVAVHRQAWEIVDKLDDANWRRILEEPDHIQRVVLAMEMDFSPEDMTRLVTGALNVDASEARKIGLATAMYFAFRHTDKLTPAAWEPLSNLTLQVLQPRTGTLQLAPNAPDLALWREIKTWITSQTDQTAIMPLLVNYLLSGFPRLWRQYKWQDAVEQFKADLTLFNINEVIA